MGNITSLTRKGLCDNGIYGNIDRLTLTYDGNQLISVSDAVTDPTYSNAWNFSDGANAYLEYEYDENGNLKKDSNKGILSIQYNSLNLPRKISFSGGNMTTLTYSANGKKLKAVYAANTISPLDATTPINSWSNPASESVNSTGGSIAPILTGNKTVEYVGNLIYENGVLKQMLVEGGYVSFGTNNAPTYHFYIQDHLGNNRVVVSQSGTVEQVNHYYPYGGLMAESTGWNVQRYKYNGKEFDRMHGLDWYDYGARWMDAAIGRWHSMDPLAEKYYDVSPYLYCKGDPINKFDPDGRVIETVWDIGNVVYDVGAAIYNHITGDHDTARSHWVDAGVDALATLTPFVPAGASKIIRGGDKVVSTFQSNIKAGRNFEKKVVEKAKKEGRNISTQITVVPQNGKGNIKGNRSRVDMMEKKKDGTYTATEIKLSSKSRPSRGQKAVEEHVNYGNKRFEVRSENRTQGFKKGDEITISEYKYKYKR